MISNEVLEEKINRLIEDSAATRATMARIEACFHSHDIRLTKLESAHKITSYIGYLSITSILAYFGRIVFGQNP